MSYKVYFGANIYNTDAYGSGTYQNATTSTGNNNGGTAGGGLANTGYDVIIPVALGAAVILASAAMLVKNYVLAKTS